MGKRLIVVLLGGLDHRSGHSTCRSNFSSTQGLSEATEIVVGLKSSLQHQGCTEARVAGKMITPHRCHKKEFLHLLVADGEEQVIPKSLQLVAGKTAQEFNRRKERKGAFWEERYHATPIETGDHLLRCLVYIDLNMVRNGVVQHPSAWQHGGYNEIQHSPRRYVLINREKLIACCGLESDEELRKSHRQWVEEAIIRDGNTRQPQWSEGIAVGSERFVRDVLEKLQARAKGRKVREGDDRYELKESQAAYNAHFTSENVHLRIENEFYWSQ